MDCFCVSSSPCVYVVRVRERERGRGSERACSWWQQPVCISGLSMVTILVNNGRRGPRWVQGCHRKWACRKELRRNDVPAGGEEESAGSWVLTFCICSWSPPDALRPSGDPGRETDRERRIRRRVCGEMEVGRHKRKKSSELSSRAKGKVF